MKKIYTICLLFALWAFVSCSPEEDDVFDKTAAERIDETIANNLDVLRGAKNGWILEYYPSEAKLYGGFTILINFDKDGTASISCDLFAPDKVVKSEYEVKQSTGVMLTFDTYNEIFHFFSEPSNFLGIGDDGTGMEGDYEFLIMECNPDEVVLKGKKTGTKMRMLPLPEEKEWSQYLATMNNITQQAYPALYDVTVSGETEYTVTQKYHMFSLENKDGSSISLPFVYTADGIKFYEPINIGGQQVQTLQWDNSTMSYINGSIAIKAQELPEGYTRFEDFIGSYIFVYYNGRSTQDVTLEKELFNNSFIMKGFPVDLRVVYKATTGAIGIETQALGGNYYLCPWSLKQGGAITIAAGAGVEGQMIDGIIRLVDNGVWSKITDSLIAFDIVNGQDMFQIAYVTGMIKND